MAQVPGYIANNMNITYEASDSPIVDAINMIGKTYVESMVGGQAIKGLAGAFVRDAVPFGKTIRTMNVTIPNSKAFDPNATDSELKVAPTVKSEYADLNYGATIPLEEYFEYWNPAFESEGVDGDFRAAVAQSIYERMDIDMYNMAKSRISRITTATGEAGYTGGYEIVENDGSGDALEALLNKIKKTITAIKYPSTAYNRQGVLNAARDIGVLIPEDTLTDIDTKVLAKVFGPNYMNIQDAFVPFDGFDTVNGTKPEGMNKVECVVMDKRAINYHPRAVVGYDDMIGRRNMHFIGVHIWGTWRDMYAMPAVAIGSGDTAVSYTATPLS